jgi:signal transduction histidine kinase/CheY-like chemotaxis protein
VNGARTSPQAALDAIVVDSLKPAAIGLSGLYVLFAVSHLLTLPRAAAIIMAPVAAMSSLALLVLFLVLRRHPAPGRWAHPIVASIAAVVLVNSLLHLRLLQEPHQATNLMLLVIGVSFLFLSAPWAAGFYVVTFLGWVAVAPDTLSPMWLHYGFALVSAITLSAIVHAARLRTYRRIEGLRLQNEARQADSLRLLREQAARSEAEEARRRLEQFIAMLAHELRNPLGVVGNVAHSLRLGLQSGRTEERTVETLERQVHHQARLVDDLLDVSRISHGKIDLRPEPLDLVAAVSSVVEDHRPMLDAAGLTLLLDFPEERRLQVSADPARLAQILANLLSNAAKYTPQGGEVTVRVRAVDEEPPGVEVVVSDTGAGIEPEILPQIFEPFAQADRSLDRSRGGLGLGLALAKGLAELHGGTIRARSDGPGRGAEFVVRLPRLAAEVALPSPAPASDTSRLPRSPKEILVVEDNAAAAETLRDLLLQYGHHVEVAASGPAGLAAARRHPPDVVLCDLGLPEMDGYALARELRRYPETASARLIAVSGYGQPEDRRLSREAGFDGHLTKPIDFRDLQRLLAEDLPVRS